MQRLAYEMRQEHLPEECVETILTVGWTTCLEVLPTKERARGRSFSFQALRALYVSFPSL